MIEAAADEDLISTTTRGRKNGGSARADRRNTVAVEEKPVQVIHG